MERSRRPLIDDLESRLTEHRKSGLWRQRRTAATRCGPLFEQSGQVLLSFASNDYLGLAGSVELQATAAQAATRWGVGSGASHLVSGHTEAHEALERRLASFTGFPASLLFSTGYLANLAVAPALLGRGDVIFADRLNHASLVDAALLSRAELVRYPHLDLDYLARRLADSQAPHKMIISDAVFSMDGDIAPLTALLQLAERYDAWLMIDDAHGFGVLGPDGRGALAEAGLDSPRLILMATLGKAAGVSGAFVAASALVIEWLLQKARPYIFTTASPPLLAECLLQVIDRFEQDAAPRARLQANIERFRRTLDLHRYRLAPSRTAIQPIIIGDNHEAVEAAEALQTRGIFVPAIRPPTVPQGSARLRISLSAAHRDEDIDRLVTALHEIERLRS